MATFIAGPQVRHELARPAALRANPNVAITIDTEVFPPEVLLIRGQASVTEVGGVVKEFEGAARHYLGEEGAKSFLNQASKPGVRMARIAVRLTGVGTLDFQTRLPKPCGWRCRLGCHTAHEIGPSTWVPSTFRANREAQS